jgi:FkbM family methyltransferase
VRARARGEVRGDFRTDHGGPPRSDTSFRHEGSRFLAENGRGVTGGRAPGRTVPTSDAAAPTYWADVGGGVRLAYSHPLDLLGILEVHVMDVYAARQLTPGALVLDLGASMGDYTVLASRQVGPRGRVIAVEPSPHDVEILRNNVRTNGCENVTVVNAALSSQAGTVHVSFKDSEFTARTATLPEILTEAGLTLEQVRSGGVNLKLDIEGAEVGALRDLVPVLPAVTAIAIELHGTRAEVDAIVGPAGFTFERLTRGTYLRNSLAFAIRHPIAAGRLWRDYRRSPRYTGAGKIARGIDIAASDELAVGVYRRVRSSALGPSPGAPGPSAPY